MFKLQSRFKSLDINKNLEQYKFFPKQRNTNTNYKQSFSEDKKDQIREKLFDNNINTKKIIKSFLYIFLEK